MEDYSVIAKLNLGVKKDDSYEHSYDIIECTYKSSRSFNRATFTPDTNRCQTLIDIMLTSPDKSDLALYEWYLMRTVYSGEVYINLAITSSSLELEEPCKLTFTGGYCYEITEGYDVLNSVTTGLNIKKYDDPSAPTVVYDTVAVTKVLKIRIIATSASIEKIEKEQTS